MQVLQHKVVATLPVPLQPNSIYYVRKGTGFDINVTNDAGVIVAYSLNANGWGATTETPIAMDANLCVISGVYQGGGDGAINFAPLGNYGTLIVTRRGSQIEQLNQYGAIGMGTRNSMDEGVTWSTWIFGHNTFNQLAIGITPESARTALELGQAMPTIEATVDTLSLGTVIYVSGMDSECVLKGLPSLETEPTHPRWWNIRTDGVSNRTTQYASEVYGVGTTKGRAFTRVKHDAVWSVWREILVDGSHGIGERGNPSVPASSGLAYNAFLGGNTLAVNSTGPYISFLVMQEHGVHIGSNKDGVAWSANIWHSANQLALGTTPKTARQALELVDEGDGWVDLRPYLLPPFYWDPIREGRNPHPRIRKLPSGRVELDGVVSWNETPAAPQNGIAFRVPPEFRPVHTTAGVSFVDTEPLYFGTGQWIMSGEVEYSSGLHGDMMLILGNPPSPSQGVFGLNGVGWFLD